MTSIAEINPQYLSSLNDQQLSAVKYIDGPSLILAGAGSGKTTVLTAKIAYLISTGMAPCNIMALTFTNKAAKEMQQRIAKIVGETKSRSLWLGTFHSVFSRILRKEAYVFGFNSGYTIYQPSDTISLLKSIVKERGLDDKIYKPSLVAARISDAKNSLYTPRKYSECQECLDRDRNDNLPFLNEIYAEYFRRCHTANAMDFDDLLLFTYALFELYPEVREKYVDQFHHILVDEYQDTNFAQAAILQQLVGDRQRISVVGDDAQSIYGFRGASISNILQFEKKYKGTHVFRLEKNYRSTQNIVNAANSLIQKNRRQMKKTMYSENEVGAPVVLTKLTSDVEEGETICHKIKELHDKSGVEYSDIAVLYRTNGQSRILEETMCKRNIPCVIYGGISFYEHKEIRDVLAYLRLIANPQDEEAMRRIINRPARGIGNVTVDKLFGCARKNDIAPLLVVQHPESYELNVSKVTKEKLIAFSQLIEMFREAAKSQDAYQMGRMVLEESGLMPLAKADLSSEGREVLDNYSSLLSGMSQFVDSQREEGNANEVSLTDYLGEISLLTDSDKKVKDGNAVSLMTIHMAKGLEFSVVFVAGMEEGLFPNVKSVSCDDIDEERRLFFVALTRAMKMCFLSCAKIRFMFGKSDYYEPSRFLQDIDSRYVKYETASFDREEEKNRTYFFGQEKFSRSATQYSTGSHLNLHNDNVIGRLKQLRPNSSQTKDSSKLIGNIEAGRKVEHAKFGLGIVIAVENGVAGWSAVINFKNFGEKKLLLKYAKLRAL